MTEAPLQTRFVSPDDLADETHRMRGWMSVSAMNVALAAAYAAVDALGHASFAQTEAQVSLVWLPSGLSLAALILFGPALLPGVLGGAVLVGVLFGVGPGATSLSALGNGGEAVVGWAMLTRAAFSPRLNRPHDLLTLAGLGAVAAVVGATCDTAALNLDAAGQPVTWRVWSNEWLGHAGGIVVLTPVLLLGARGTPSWRTLVTRSETWMIGATLAGTAVVVFGGVTSSLTTRLVGVFLSYLVIVWAGLRLGPRGAACAAFLVATLAIGGRANGAGPLGEQAHPSLLWAYLFSLSVTAVVLATTVAQRDSANRARRLADLEVRDLEDQVRHAQRLEGIGLLAGGVAHDFNNLLLVIRANASLIAPIGPQAEYVAEIETATRQAADLCRQLLTYAGRSSPAFGPVELQPLVDEMRTLLRTTIPETTRIETDFRTTRPVRADATQVRQAVMNLVLNGSEAVGTRGGTLWLRIGEMACDARYLGHTFLHSGAAPGQFVFLEVEDDGCGMDNATLRRMFDPFFTTKASGRGLGLMTVAGIVRSHDGAIKVTSVLGRGSCFRLVLPPWVGPPEPQKWADPQSLPTRPSGATVLVADDDAAVLRATSRILRKAGYQVLTARDGAEAVEVYRTHVDRVGAVLMDVTMPGLTGPEAFIRMRDLAGAVPVVLMSGNLPAGPLPEIAGCRVLTKPFGSELLLEAVGEAVGRGRTRLRPST